MDSQTLAAYDHASARYAQEWRDQPPPDDMYALLRQFFRPGPTVDVGCGAGRDVAWMNANGFECSGIDASCGLLQQARQAYPSLSFGRATLPALDGVPAGAYENVLCETVLMHLDPAQIAPATQRLVELLKPAGTLYLSWRVTPGASRRDDQGRLYAAFDAGAVMNVLAREAEVLSDHEVVSASSGKVIHRVLARRIARDTASNRQDS